MRRAALLLVPAVLGAGLVIVTRPDQDPELDTEPVGRAATPEIELAPSGLVVSLTRSAAGLPVPVGLPQDFFVGATSADPVVRVELWDGDAVVAASELPGDRTRLEPRLEWSPPEPGRHLLTARAVDSQGRVGLSNPLWVDVVEPLPSTLPDLPPVGYPPADDPATEAAPPFEPLDGTVVAASMQRQAVLVRRQVSSILPELVLTTDGCEVEATASVASEGSAQLVLLMVPPNGGSAVPVADLGVVEATSPAGLTATLGGGTQAFLLAEVVDGAIAGWSAPVVAEADPTCTPPGWTGDLVLTDGKLHADTDAVDAYLYLEPEPGRWLRVPATGGVPNIGGAFDFGPHLPNLPGGFELRAWGRGPGGVSLIGTGVYEPPPSTPPATVAPSASFTPGGFLPPTTLRYLKPAKDGQPAALVTEASIDVDPDDDLLGEHIFTWSTPLGAVSHGLVQVSVAPLPDGAGPTSFHPQFTCLVPGTGGLLKIDFDAETCEPGLPPADLSAGQGSYGNLVPSEVALGIGQPNVGTKNPLDALEEQINQDPEMPAGGDVPWVIERIIRVLPMTGSTWHGVRSNDVRLEIDRTPKVPPGEYAYDLDLEMVSAPRPPRYAYMSCWQFTGWADPVAAQQAAAQEQAAFAQQLAQEKALNPAFGSLLRPNSVQHPHYFWNALVTNHPIVCAGCYGVSWPGVGSSTLSLGGADCTEDSSFWEDPIGWVGTHIVGPIISVFKDLVNLAADGFAYLKSKAVEGLMTITQCTGEFCETLATAVVNGALLALGVPPTIPNFDQLVALGKGELVNVAVGLAKSAGVPCDEAGAAASLADQDDLTCEALVSAMLDEVVTAMNESFLTAAKSGGIHFPADMHIVPAWAGQPGGATMKVTVTPTKYTAEEKGATCIAGVLSSSSWTASSTSYTDPDLGVVTIPHVTWNGAPFQVTSWQLPALPEKPGAEHGYAPVTKTFVLATPVAYDLVDVHKSQKTLVGPVDFPFKMSRHAFLFHQGATFQVSVGSPCARPETHTYVLDGSLKAQLVSVVEG